MHDQPSTSELIEAVKNFIDTTATTKLTGHDAFQARIASNVLAIVSRELEQRPHAEASETQRLSSLLNAAPGETEKTLNAALAEAIQAGRMTAQTPRLLEHLKTTAIAQLKIDQPNYSGLKTIGEETK